MLSNKKFLSNSTSSCDHEYRENSSMMQDTYLRCLHYQERLSDMGTKAHPRANSPKSVVIVDHKLNQASSFQYINIENSFSSLKKDHATASEQDYSQQQCMGRGINLSRVLCNETTSAAVCNDMIISTPSFLVLDGIQFLSLGKVDHNSQRQSTQHNIDRSTRNTVQEALDRWMEQVASKILIGQLKQENHQQQGIDIPNKRESTSCKPSRKNSSSGVLRLTTKKIPKSCFNDPALNHSILMKRMLPSAHIMVFIHILNNEFEQALAKLETIYSEDLQKYGTEKHVIVSVDAHNLGVVHLLCHNYDQSYHYFHKAAHIKKCVFHASSIHIATSLIELGNLRYIRKDFKRAMSSFNEALNILHVKQQQREQSTAVRNSKAFYEFSSTLLNNIACVLYQRQDCISSLAFLQKSLMDARLALKHSSMSSKKSGVPELALIQISIVYCNIGLVHYMNWKWDDAIVAFDEALLVQESVFGENKVASKYMNHNINVCRRRFLEVS